MNLDRLARVSIALLCLAGFQGLCRAADKSVIGTGRLLSSISMNAECGVLTNAFGEQPVGHLLHGSGGRMTVNLFADDRAKVMTLEFLRFV